MALANFLWDRRYIPSTHGDESGCNVLCYLVVTDLERMQTSDEEIPARRHKHVCVVWRQPGGRAMRLKGQLGMPISEIEQRR